MLDFTTMDMIIIGLILFLSLKGLVNGFIREFFSFMGLIGGVYIASRVSTQAGEFINANIFPIENEPALKLAGFVAVLIAVWLVANMLSSIFEKISTEEVGFLSRIFGYAMALAKWVAIVGLIFASVQDVELISKKLEKQTQSSQLTPQLKEIGAILLNLESRKTELEEVVPPLPPLNQEKGTGGIDLEAYEMDLNTTNPLSLEE